MSHTLQEVIDLAVKTAVLKAHPVGSYWITETDDDPKIIFGGGVWERVQGKFLQCSDDTHPAGTDIDAGLPDITGGYDAARVCAFVWATTPTSGNNTWDGALGLTSSLNGENVYPTDWNENKDSRRPYGLCFDASRSSSIYGNSDTVQPPAHVVNVWKRTA